MSSFLVFCTLTEATPCSILQACLIFETRLSSGTFNKIVAIYFISFTFPYFTCPLMHPVHRPDGLIGLLYLALLPQVEDFLYSHYL